VIESAAVAIEYQRLTSPRVTARNTGGRGRPPSCCGPSGIVTRDATGTTAQWSVLRRQAASAIRWLA